MKHSYHIAQHVQGELRLGPGPEATTFEYEPGEHPAHDDAEIAVLEHLVRIGAAGISVAPKQKSKEASHDGPDR